MITYSLLTAIPKVSKIKNIDPKTAINIKNSKLPAGDLFKVKPPYFYKKYNYIKFNSI